MDKLIGATWNAPTPADKYRQQVQHIIQRAVVDEMMTMASRADNSAAVRAVLSDRLGRLAVRIETTGASRSAYKGMVAADIRRWEVDQLRTSKIEAALATLQCAEMLVRAEVQDCPARDFECPHFSICTQKRTDC